LPSPRESRGGRWPEHRPDRTGTRGLPGFASTSPHAGNSGARQPNRFGGWFLLTSHPGVGHRFEQVRAPEGEWDHTVTGPVAGETEKKDGEVTDTRTERRIKNRSGGKLPDGLTPPKRHGAHKARLLDINCRNVGYVRVGAQPTGDAGPLGIRGRIRVIAPASPHHSARRQRGRGAGPAFRGDRPAEVDEA